MTPTNLKLRIARTLTHSSYFLMLLALTINAWLQNAPLVIYVISLLPLMIFIPGMLRSNPRTLIWVCFVILMYFAVAVDNLAGPAPHPMDIVELILTIILFNAAMLFARWRQQEINARINTQE